MMLVTKIDDVAILNVPLRYGSCPYIQTTDPAIIAKCKGHLMSYFRDVALRSEVFVDDQLLSAEFHRLNDKDPEAGLRLLMFLRKQGYEIERVDISQSEHGSYMVAIVYVLVKRS